MGKGDSKRHKCESYTFIEEKSRDIRSLLFFAGKNIHK